MIDCPFSPTSSTCLSVHHIWLFHLHVSVYFLHYYIYNLNFYCDLNHFDINKLITLSIFEANMHSSTVVQRKVHSKRSNFIFLPKGNFSIGAAVFCLITHIEYLELGAATWRHRVANHENLVYPYSIWIYWYINIFWQT